MFIPRTNPGTRQWYEIYHDNQPIYEIKFYQFDEFNHWDEFHNCNGDLEGDEYTQVIYFIKEVMNLVDLMN